MEVDNEFGVGRSDFDDVDVLEGELLQDQVEEAWFVVVFFVEFDCD